MTAARHLDCRCSHSKEDHDREGFAPQCTATACTCLAYRPAVHQREASPTPIRAAVAEADPSADQIIAAGITSDSKRTKALAEKVCGLLVDLSARLADEKRHAEKVRKDRAEREQAQKEVERLARELAEAKARAKGKPVAHNVQRAARAVQGDGVCPQCGKSGLTNVGAHRMKAHGYRRAAS